jgi:hypothetical protein
MIVASTYALLDLDGPAPDRAPAATPSSGATPGDLQNCFWRRWQQWADTRPDAGTVRRHPPRH